MEIFRRDGWLCHLCAKPVVFAPALKYLQEELAGAGFADLAYWRYAYSREFAPLLDELAAVLDHVDPHAKGGLASVENLRTACNKCNMRRGDANYIAWVERNPAKKSSGNQPRTWDGLSNLFVFLARRHHASLTRTEKEWLHALERTRQVAKAAGAGT